MGKSLIRILLPQFLPTCAVPHRSQVTPTPATGVLTSSDLGFLLLSFLAQCLTGNSLCRRGVLGAFSKASLRNVNYFSLRRVPHSLYLAAHVTPYAVPHLRRRIGTTKLSYECVSCSLIIANLFSEQSNKSTNGDQSFVSKVEVDTNLT